MALGCIFRLHLLGQVALSLKHDTSRMPTCYGAVAAPTPLCDASRHRNCGIFSRIATLGPGKALQEVQVDRQAEVDHVVEEYVRARELTGSSKAMQSHVREVRSPQLDLYLLTFGIRNKAWDHQRNRWQRNAS